MKSTVAAACLAAAVSSLSPGVLAAEPGDHHQSELSRQRAIYQAQGQSTPPGYVVDRGLEFYEQTLAADFRSALSGLGRGHRWLDIGAGRGQAILDYFAPSYTGTHAKSIIATDKAQAVAISMEDRRTPDWNQTAKSLQAGQMQYFFDKPLRAYSSGQLGNFQVITDMFGGFSYTDDLSLFMEKTLGFLDVNGTFYTLLQDVKAEGGANKPYYPDSPYLTELSAADGSELRMCAWLKRISCVQVSCELKSDWKPPIEVYRIQKTCGKVAVPALTRTHYVAGTPPERRFRLGR